MQQQPSVQPQMQMVLQGKLTLLLANIFQVVNHCMKRGRHERSQVHEGASRLRRIAESAAARAGFIEKRLQLPIEKISQRRTLLRRIGRRITGYGRRRIRCATLS